MIWIFISLPDLTVTKMVEVLKTQIQSGASPSRITALGWVHHLFECLPEKVFFDFFKLFFFNRFDLFSFPKMPTHIDALFPTLFRVLSDSSDEVSQMNE